LTSIDTKIFRRTAEYTLFFYHKRDEEILEELKVERETKKIQVKLATTCNKNEQQQDVKNNAEFVEQMDEDNLKDLGIDYQTRSKQVYQGLTGDG